MILSCPNCDTKFRVKDDAIGPNGRKVKCRNCANTWHAMPDNGAAPAAAPAPAPAPPAPQPAPAPAPAPAPEPVAEEPPAPPPPPPQPAPTGAAEIPADSPPIPGPDPIEDVPPPTLAEPPPIPPGEDFVLRQRKPKVEKKSPLMAWVILIFLILVIGVAGFFLRKDIIAAYPPIVKVYSWLGIAPNMLGHGLTLPDPTLSVAERNDDGIKLIFSGQILTSLDEATDLPMLRGTLVDSNGDELHVWYFQPSKPNILPGEIVEYSTEVVNPPQGAVKADIEFVSQSAAEDAGHGEEPMDMAPEDGAMDSEESSEH